MRATIRSIGGMWLLCLCAVGCQTKVDTGVPANPPTSSSASAAIRIDQPLQFKNLTIFPVISNEPRNDDRYVTLEEGLKAGTVQVYELGGISGDNPPPNDAPNEPPAPQAPPSDANPFGDDADPFAEEPASPTPAPPPAPDPTANLEDPFADTDPPANADTNPFDDRPAPQAQAGQSEVDPFAQTEQQLIGGGDAAVVERVMVVNIDKRPLYMMPGEIILGGKQDRCLAKETIVPPGGQPTPVEVFCVEHGRWNDRTQAEFAQVAASAGDNFPSSLSLIVDGTDTEELGKRFVASAGALNKAGRLAVQDAKDQSKVWNEIAQINAAVGNEVASGSFTGNYASEDIRKQLQPYLEALEEKISGREQVVGVIVAINGKVEGADIFESTPLFRKLWPKLLQSYAFDAMAAADGANQQQTERPVSIAAAKQFLDDLQQAQVEESEAVDGLVLTSRESGTASVFSASSSDAMHSHGGGFGGAVHTSAFAK